MDNQFDVGMQEDFNNMTLELGREVYVYPRDDELTHEGQEGTDSGLEDPVTEVVFVQELDSEHEMVASGQLDVGDVRMTFLHNSIVEIEGYVSPDKGTSMFKVLTITKVMNQSNNAVVYIKAFGKRVYKGGR